MSSGAQAQELRPYEAALHIIPQPPGAAKNCAAFRPPGPLPAGIGGVTDLAIHIGSDGMVSRAAILVSSGDPGFDAAAVACADAVFIQPAQRDGVPVAVDWVGRLDWHRPPESTYVAIALSDERLRVCMNYPPQAMKRGEQGTVAVTFDVMPDGSTDNFKVAYSTGFDDLDAAATACFQRYQFFPPTDGGKPITISWRGVQNFKMYTPEPVEPSKTPAPTKPAP